MSYKYFFIFLSSVLLAGCHKTADATLLKPSCIAGEYPPKEQDWNFSLEPYNEQGWTYSLTTSEIVEPYLGTVIFDELPKRLETIRGVKSVKQDDREYYLIKSNGITSDKLKAEIWHIFQLAAFEACGKTASAK